MSFVQPYTEMDACVVVSAWGLAFISHPCRLHSTAPGFSLGTLPQPERWEALPSDSSPASVVGPSQSHCWFLFFNQYIIQLCPGVNPSLAFLFLLI